MHGIAVYGNVGAFSCTGNTVGSIANTAAAGIINIADPASGLLPQGNSYRNCLVQNTGPGFDLASGDMTMTHCHAQSCNGRGISVTGTGGDCRISDCRSDLSATASGFYVSVPCGQYLGMVQLSNCSTQRNQQNGIVIDNPVLNQEISPVSLSNCVFQGDGIDTASAAIRLQGQVGVIFTGCSSHVNTLDVGAGVPKTAIPPTTNGLAPPAFLQMAGGFYNASPAFPHPL